MHSPRANTYPISDLSLIQHLRLQGKSEDEVLAIAKAAAADAVATYELANDHPDAGEDAQSRYYR